MTKDIELEPKLHKAIINTTHSTITRSGELNIYCQRKGCYQFKYYKVV